MRNAAIWPRLTSSSGRMAMVSSSRRTRPSVSETSSPSSRPGGTRSRRALRHDASAVMAAPLKVLLVSDLYGRCSGPIAPCRQGPLQRSSHPGRRRSAHRRHLKDAAGDPTPAMPGLQRYPLRRGTDMTLTTYVELQALPAGAAQRRFTARPAAPAVAEAAALAAFARRSVAQHARASRSSAVRPLPTFRRPRRRSRRTEP